MSVSRSLRRRALLAVLVGASSCAEAEEQGTAAGTGSGAGPGGRAGSGSSGSSAGAGLGGSASLAGSSSAGTTSGAGTTSTAGTSAAGTSSGGTSSGGTTSGAGTTSSAGTTGSGDAGSGSGDPPGLGCVVEGGGAGGADGAGAGAGGAGGAGGAPEGWWFFDDFETGDAAPWTTAGGTWSVIEDGGKVYEQALTQNQLQLSMVDGSCWADQIVEARVKISDFPGASTSYLAGVFARVLGPETHYFVALGSDEKLAIRKRVDSSSTSATRIGSAVDAGITTGVWYTVKLEVIGSTLKAYLDGELLVTATDTSIASGGVAVGTTNATAVFDDVKVSAP